MISRFKCCRNSLEELHFKVGVLLKTFLENLDMSITALQGGT